MFLWWPPCGRVPVNSSGLLCCGVRTVKVSVNTSSITIPDSRGYSKVTGEQGSAVHWQKTLNKSHSSGAVGGGPGTLDFTVFRPKVSVIRNPWRLCEQNRLLFGEHLYWRTVISVLRIFLLSLLHSLMIALEATFINAIKSFMICSMFLY